MRVTHIGTMASVDVCALYGSETYGNIGESGEESSSEHGECAEYVFGNVKYHFDSDFGD